MARPSVPLREITPEEIWKEVQQLRHDLETHDHLMSGSKILDGVVGGYLRSTNYEAGSAGWILRPNSCELINVTVSGYVKVSETAADVNAYSTQINPGQVLVSGSTSLSDWRASGDLTKIDGGNIYTGTVTTSQLNFTPLISSGGTGEIIATINASTEGIVIAAANIAISGSTTFSAGYNPSQKIADATYGTGGSYASASSGARVRMFPTTTIGLQVIDDGGNDVFKALVGGTDVGDVIIGDYSGGQGLKYDKSAATIYYKNLQWSEVTDDDGNRPANNATVGATFGTDISGGGSGDNQVSNNGYVGTITANIVKANSSFVNNLNVKSTLTMGDASTDGIIQSYGWNGSANGFKILGGSTPSIEIIGGIITSSLFQTATSGNNRLQIQSTGGYANFITWWDSSDNLKAYIYESSSDLVLNADSDIYLTSNNYVICKGDFVPDSDGTYDLGLTGTGWQDICLSDASSPAIRRGTTGYIFLTVSGVDITQTLYPNTDNSIDLGTSGNQWKDLYIDGTAYLDAISMGGNIIPEADGSYNLGSSSYAWDNVWLMDIYTMTGSGSTWIFAMNRNDANVDIINKNFVPYTDNTHTCGSSGQRWSDLRSVLINGSDYGFENDWVLTEHDRVGIKEKGIAVLNASNKLRAFIGETGVYAPGGEIKNLDMLPYTKTTIEQRKLMDNHPEKRERLEPKTILAFPDPNKSKVGGAKFAKKEIRMNKNVDEPVSKINKKWEKVKTTKQVSRAEMERKLKTIKKIERELLFFKKKAKK